MTSAEATILIACHHHALRLADRAQACLREYDPLMDPARPYDIDWSTLAQEACAMIHHAQQIHTLAGQAYFAARLEQAGKLMTKEARHE